MVAESVVAASSSDVRVIAIVPTKFFKYLALTVNLNMRPVSSLGAAGEQATLPHFNSQNPSEYIAPKVPTHQVAPQLPSTSPRITPTKSTSLFAAKSCSISGALALFLLRLNGLSTAPTAASTNTHSIA
jgi:hypothetical protein